MTNQMEASAEYQTTETLLLRCGVAKSTDGTVEKVRNNKLLFPVKPQKSATQAFIFEAACKAIERIGAEEFFLLGTDDK